MWEPPSRPGSRIVLSLLLSILPVAVLLADNHIWLGTGGTPLWSAGANWVPPDPNDPSSGVPDRDPNEASPVSIQFPSLSGVRNTNQDLLDPLANSITFSGPSYVIVGQGISVGGTVTVTNDPNDPGPAFHQIAVPVTLRSDMTTNVTDPTVVLAFLQPITGPHAITTNGPGTTVLQGNNAYTGFTLAQSGTLVLANTNALGDTGQGTFIQGGATLVPSDYSGPLDPNDPGSVEGITLFPGSVLGGNGTNTLPVLSVPGAGAASVILNPPVVINILDLEGPGPLTQNGGTLHVGGASGYTGSITVLSGNLGVDGAMPGGTIILSGPAAVLRGSGTTGPVTVNQGQVAPGASPGILNVGGIAWSGAATSLSVELNGLTAGSGYDRVKVTGSAGLAGAILAVTRSFLPPSGTVFTIVQTTGGVSGTFGGLPEGAIFAVSGQSYRINYLTNDVTLTAVDALPVQLERFRAE